MTIMAIIAITTPVLALSHIAALLDIDAMIIVHTIMAILPFQSHIKMIRGWFPIRQSVHNAAIGCITKRILIWIKICREF